MAGPLPLHLLPDTAAVGDDGRLRIGGCDLLDLAAEHGTPLFVYDEVHLRARCREAVAAFGDGVAYASKAFLCRAREAGVGRIVVDSFDELDRLETLHAADGLVPRVLLRVTPGVEAHTHEFVRTGQDDSKFGFTLST